jgi:cold shock CspA family protein
VVVDFDDHVGLGTIEADDGTAYTFHAIEIVDGSRTIDREQSVSFEPLARFGRFQAGRIDKR